MYNPLPHCEKKSLKLLKRLLCCYKALFNRFYGFFFFGISIFFFLHILRPSAAKKNKFSKKKIFTVSSHQIQGGEGKISLFIAFLLPNFFCQGDPLTPLNLCMNMIGYNIMSIFLVLKVVIITGVYCIIIPQAATTAEDLKAYILLCYPHRNSQFYTWCLPAADLPHCATIHLQSNSDITSPDPLNKSPFFRPKGNLLSKFHCVFE